MRKAVFVLLASLIISACDDDRVYENNFDFEHRLWPVSQVPQFEFDITDSQVQYNLYCNIRNTVSFPYSRLFINYSLKDSSGVQLQRKLTSVFLFDEHSGKPQGASGLGDIYDHRIPLLKNHQFSHTGKYSIQFQQFMRTDSLQGVLAVGLRVEKASAD